MRKGVLIGLWVAVAALLSWYWLSRLPDVSDAAIPHAADAVERGRYLVHAAGCISCHAGADAAGALSGGLALDTPFGTFHAPNITPDPDTGIGDWTGRQFLLALKHGRPLDGGFYYPAFPYPAYAGMSDQDALDIAAYLMSRPAVRFTVAGHDTPVWLGRWMIAGWNALNRMMRPAIPDPADPVIARGAYLARHLGHCGECHTPRNAIGIPDLRREFAGAMLGDGRVEPIDAEAMDGWSEEDFSLFLSLGMKPDGEFVGGEMETVIDHNTSRLTPADRQALAAFFVRGQAAR